MSTAATIDDIQSDIWHLYHLLDALAEHMIGMPHVRDGERDRDMDRASSIAWIARDITFKLASSTDGVSDAMARTAVRQ